MQIKNFKNHGGVPMGHLFMVIPRDAVRMWASVIDIVNFQITYITFLKETNLSLSSPPL